MSVVEEDLFIGGRWVPASSGETFEVTDPATDEVIGRVADASAADGLTALDAAQNAGPDWAATPPRERGEVLRRAFELMGERREDLARTITTEMGKSLDEARGEVDYAAEFLRWFAEEAVRANGNLVTAPGGQYRMLTRMQPVGVSLLVTPWNFPAAMATRKIGPALAAGCTTILKPASATPLTAFALARVFADAGVPDGVVNVVSTSSSGALTEPLLADPRLRKLSFTGSTEVGRALLHQAADQVLRTSMELGGNAPFLVLADADLDVAVEAAVVAKLRNIGQSCVAANRFHVHRSLAEEFAERLAEKFAAQRVGHGLDDGVQLGSLINTKARDEVLELIRDATDRGARLLTGGEPVGDRGACLSPAVLVDVPADARCVQEEIFGPVAPVVAFDDPDEAVSVANGTIFGLVGYVIGGDLQQALSVAERLEVGMVGINRGVVSDPAAPFGGWKQSGLGREGGHEGLLEYLETKYIAAQW
ncbi:NAD-dependent succinate-semialdehyde dehydrogenase [Enemella sp. A6]|uniref:NAD-dependent succinate-semialdehyde dehydrogenase n=1 Tax=Enemella sp. A6 TaxID=3440152 RepID=UPI003EBB51D1